MFRALIKLIKFTLILLGLMVVVWCVIHRRVIKAKLFDGEMPEMPAWHKECFKKFLDCCGSCEK